MSVRANVGESSGGAPKIGTLFSSSIGNEIWERLAGSPVVRPTTPSDIPSLCFDRCDSVNDMEIDMSELRIQETLLETTQHGVFLDSVVHTNELPQVFSYCYFERESGSCMVTSPSGTFVANSNPVIPRVVVSDRVVWMPVLSSLGETGHKFMLIKNDVVQAHIEVFVDETTESLKVLFVHGLYSHFSYAAKLVDKHSLLEFNTLQSHIEKIYKTMSSITEDSMYLPVNEVLVGASLSPTNAEFLRVSVPDHLASHPHANSVHQVWHKTTEKLQQLSSLVINCITQHNTFEFTRAGVMY